MTVLIKQLINPQEWKEAFPVMKQLRTHLNEEEFLALVDKSSRISGYKLTGLYDEGEVRAVIGFMPMITLYSGEYIWICDLVTDAKYRSLGYGNTLLSYAENWAKENNYGIVSLSSGLQRIDAHRFYEHKMAYDKVSYVFLKKL